MTFRINLHLHDARCHAAHAQCSVAWHGRLWGLILDCLDTLDGVVSLRCLVRQHQTVCAIEHAIGNVRRLGACRHLVWPPESGLHRPTIKHNRAHIGSGSSSHRLKIRFTSARDHTQETFDGELRGRGLSSSSLAGTFCAIIDSRICDEIVTGLPARTMSSIDCGRDERTTPHSHHPDSVCELRRCHKGESKR